MIVSRLWQYIREHYILGIIILILIILNILKVIIIIFVVSIVIIFILIKIMYDKRYKENPSVEMLKPTYTKLTVLPKLKEIVPEKLTKEEIVKTTEKPKETIIVPSTVNPTEEVIKIVEKPKLTPDQQLQYDSYKQFIQARIKYIKREDRFIKRFKEKLEDPSASDMEKKNNLAFIKGSQERIADMIRDIKEYQNAIANIK